MKLKTVCFALLLIIGSRGICQVADFNFTTATGNFCAPQTVIFTQACTGNPAGFIWNFGNGQSSVNPIDSAIYSAPGTYTVSLTALYADVAIVKTKTVTINPTPVVDLTTNTVSVCQPGIINFTATGSSFITSYEWNFGDGSPVQTTPINTTGHNFAAYGAYTITVKAITAFGCFTTDNISVEVKRFSVDGNLTPEKGCIPMTANFFTQNDLPPGDPAISYVWSFGDGSPDFTGTDYFTTHIYNVTYPVTPSVTVTSSQGCTAGFTFPEVAYGTPPLNLVAGTVSGLDTFCGREFIIMKAKAPTADGYAWDFGDNSVEITIQDTLIYYKYADTGSYRVVVTPFFHGCPGPKDSFDIYVKGVIAKFDVANTCDNRNVFTFSDNSSGHVSHFEWSFADAPGFIDSLQPVITHTFPLTGTFNTQLILIDSISGCRDTLVKPVFNALPVLSSDKPLVCKDSAITYTVSATYPPESGVKYLFFAGGNLIDNGNSPVLVHFPLNHGTYADYVIIESPNPNICNDTIRLTTPTKVAGPVTSFTSPVRVCLNTAVAVNNLTYPFFPADVITLWEWDFSDGNPINVQQPAPHLYSAPGLYNIVLTATDVNGCKLKAERFVTADPIPQITVYPRLDTICQTRDSAELTVFTIDPFTWNPSPDITCNTCDTIKVSPAATTYYVAEAVNAGGCHTFDTSFIKVYAPFDLHVSPADTAGCAVVRVNYNIDHEGITTWSPATFLSNATIPRPISVADNSITYIVIVKDSAGCYADTATAAITVYPRPVVDAGPDRVVPYGSSFSLAPIYGPNIQSYTWTPPTGLDCINCPRPTGTALQSTEYKISVTSDKGCTASDSLKILMACETGSLWLPSGFTPFNGGANNTFYPLARGYRSIKSFSVFNRLGNKVFERKDFAPNVASLGWNGNIKGELRGVGSQAFVWIIEAVCEQGDIVTAKGSVLLIR